MKQIIKLLLVLAFLAGCGFVFPQSGTPGKNKTKLLVYYFHPNERCPIDQSIEANTRKLMQSDFAKEIREGIINFQVINTDEKANAKIVSQFEMNAQALYLVTFAKGREVKNDLTEFAFSTSQNNSAKFRSRLKDEILTALKP